MKNQIPARNVEPKLSRLILWLDYQMYTTLINYCSSRKGIIIIIIHLGRQFLPWRTATEKGKTIEVFSVTASVLRNRSFEIVWMFQIENLSSIWGDKLIEMAERSKETSPLDIRLISRHAKRIFVDSTLQNFYSI